MEVGGWEEGWQWGGRWLTLSLLNFPMHFTKPQKKIYHITHTIYLLETIYTIVPYRPGKPKTFLD